MAFLKGPRRGRAVVINSPVIFNKKVTLIQDNPFADIWYIDNDNGNDGYTGETPSLAFQTLTQAATKAGEDDIVYIRSKGAQTDASDFNFIHEAAQVTIPYASVNLHIIGVTAHRTKPYYGVWFRHGQTVADTGYVLLNYAPGLCLENINFQTGSYIRSSYGAVSMYASTTGGAYKTHAGSVGFSCYNCFFRDGQLNVTGGYDGVVDGCTFEASSSSSSGFWSTSNVLPTGGHQIRRSFFGEMFSNPQALKYIHFVAGAQKNLLIDDCRFGEIPQDAHYMWFGSSNEGLVSNCYFAHDNVEPGTSDSTAEIYVNSGATIKVSGCWDNSGKQINAT